MCTYEYSRLSNLFSRRDIFCLLNVAKTYAGGFDSTDHVMFKDEFSSSASEGICCTDTVGLAETRYTTHKTHATDLLKISKYES